MPRPPLLAADVFPSVEKVYRRERPVQLITLANDCLDRRSPGFKVVNFDKDPLGRMTIKVQACKDLWLKSFDVKGQKIDFRSVRFVQEFAERRGRDIGLVGIAPALDDSRSRSVFIHRLTDY